MAGASGTQQSSRPGSRSSDSLTRREWWWLGGEQTAPVHVSQWVPYDPMVQYHLSASLDAMRTEGRADGLVLDLEPFTDPPQQYQVWRARPVEVANSREPELHGKLAIAGYAKSLWELPRNQLPPAAAQGKVVAGFYQVRSSHAQRMAELDRILADDRSPPYPWAEPPRRRIVILIEVERPAFLFRDVDRFRRRKAPAAAAAAPPSAAELAAGSDPVPHGEAVFQWWWGDPNEGGYGHWKSYHPHVSARLEKELAVNAHFRSCEEAVSIDEVRYSLQRISPERPFDYLEESSRGAGFREPFLPSNVVTVGCGLYDEQTRLTGNCFVQFQTGNPKRRRPVRRVRRGEAAGLAVPDGEPCGICFSDTGVLTGCDKFHVVCNSCLRTGLRIVIGDITQTEKLLCGCLGIHDTVALRGLAQRADETLQALVQRPPADPQGRAEYDTELAGMRRAFQLAERIPGDIFVAKLAEWQDLVTQRAMEHLYYACSHPGCAMANWILRTDFEAQHRSRNECHWVCKQGHRNSVLPTQEDIDEMNRNILLHPEHYTDMCGHDQMALRRFRLCPACVAEGLLTFAVHEAGCKQWPGGASGHRHCFCFHCTKPWRQGGCSHQVRCSDPGIQQVRRTTDSEGIERLQIGFIDAQAYISWIRTGRACPPTVFEGYRSRTVPGETRQGLLGMEDRALLARTMREGTA